MRLISRLFNRPTQVSLVREGEAFLLRFLYDDRPTGFAEVLGKWPELGALEPFIADPGQSAAAIRLADVDALRGALRALRSQYAYQSRLVFRVSAEAEAAQFGASAPEGFVVRYAREGDGLSRRLSEGTVELEDGWMRLNDRYWRFDAPAGFRRERIEPRALVAFLKTDVWDYARAGIPIRVELAYRDEPAVEIRVTDFNATGMALRPVWRVDPGTVDERFELPDHVLAGNVVRPGLRPSQLRAVFPEPDRPVRLEGVEAARFLDERYGAWRSHMAGDIAAFEALHRWVEPPFRWVLVARAKPIRGIGRAYAHPCALVGGEEFSVEQLRDMLKQPYARVASGWVRRRDLLSLGLDEGALTLDGAPLKPIRLDAELLLRRGGKKLGGPFNGMRLEGAAWRERGDKHRCAGDHLDFLLHWGINGGLTGGYEALIAYGLPMILGLRMAQRDATVLVLGTEADCDAARMASLYCGNALGGERATLLSYTAFAARPQNVRWDLACLIEPDVGLDRAPAECLRAVASLRCACRIGFFRADPSGDAGRTALAASVLGYHGGGKRELVGLLVRDSRRPMPLPEPYRFVNAVAGYGQPPAADGEGERTDAEPARDGGAVITLAGAPGRSVPIPRRRVEPEPIEGVSPLMSYRGSEPVAPPPRGPGEKPLAEAPSLMPYRKPEPAAPAGEVPRIVLDLGSVDRLRAESDQVREALIASVGDREDEGPAVAEEIRVEPEPPTPIVGAGSDEGWDVFFEQIRGQVGLDALAALLEGPEAFAALARARDEMPEPLLDRVNEIASDALGDLIADADGVFEEYLPRLQKHLTKE